MKWKALAGVFLALALLGWCVWFVVRDPSAIETLRSADPWYLAGTMVSMLLFLWSNGLVLNSMLKPANANLGFFESFHLSVVTNAGNSFLPLSAGMALRAYYLRLKHGVSLSHFIGALIGVYVVNFLVVFGTGTLVMAVLYSNGLDRVLPFLVAFSWATIALLVIAANPGLVRYFPSFVRTRAEKILEGWKSLLSDRRLVAEMAFFSLCNVAISSAMLWFSFRAVGAHLDSQAAVFLSVVNSLAIFIKLTPGNLGVTELILLAGGTALRLEPSTVILAAAFSRVAQYAALLLVLPLSLYALFGKNWLTAVRSALARSG